MKSPREHMEIVNAYELVGSYRGAADPGWPSLETSRLIGKFGEGLPVHLDHE